MIFFIMKNKKIKIRNWKHKYLTFYVIIWVYHVRYIFKKKFVYFANANSQSLYSIFLSRNQFSTMLSLNTYFLEYYTASLGLFNTKVTILLEYTIFILSMSSKITLAFFFTCDFVDFYLVNKEDNLLMPSLGDNPEL